MAEVIGLASSIAGLLSLTLQVSQLSYEYIANIKGASKSVSSYLKELLALSQILLQLKETLDGETVDKTFLPSPSPLSQFTIGECQHEIERIKERLEKRRDGPGIRSALRVMTWPFEEKETGKLIEVLHRWKGIFEAAISTNSTRSSLLGWISPESPGRKQGEILPEYHQGSCYWVVELDDFKEWSRTDDGLLWVYGSPGVGKTVLASFIVEHMRAGGSESSQVVYHYFDFKDEPRFHTVSGVARSLLRQVLERYETLPNEIHVMHSQSQITGGESDMERWKQVLCDIVRKSQNITIVVDALDECADRRRMIRFLRDLARCGARIFATSRPLDDIQTSLGKYFSAELISSDEDITNYIEARISEDDDLDALLAPGLRGEVSSKIVQIASGTFLLAKLMVDNLATASTIKQIRQALMEPPTNLREAYRSTFSRILQSAPARKTLAMRTLGWLVNVKRRLSMQELQHALAIEHGLDHLDEENIHAANSITSSCLGLISSTKHDARAAVRFAHFTVQEFLHEECKPYLDPYGFEIARACLTYLNFRCFRDGPCPDAAALNKRLQMNPLLEYIAVHWGSHVQQHEELLQMELLRLITDVNAVQSCSQAFHFCRRLGHMLDSSAFSQIPTEFGALHLLALWGMSFTAQSWIPSRADITMTDSMGWTPLHWAAARGHLAMIDFLLDRSADLEARDKRLWTPLFWAVHWDQDQAVIHLLKRGAHCTVRDIENSTPLHVAAWRGNLEVCEQLLGSGADYQAVDDTGSSPLSRAIAASNSDVADVLIQKYTPEDRTSSTTNYETALEQAARKGNESLFKLILENQTMVMENGGAEDPFMPRIQRLLDRWRGDFRKLPHLLQSFLDWRRWDNIVEPYPNFVLHYAILAARPDVVEMLVKLGVDLNKEYKFCYHRAMHAAAFGGDEAVMKSLLQHGIDPDAKDGTGQTALHYAAILGQVELVRILAQHRGLMSAADRSGQLPLHVLWSRCVSGRDNNDVTEVDPAIISRCSEVAEILVRNGADINASDNNGCTPVHAALACQNIPILSKLLTLGAHLDARAIKKSSTDCAWAPEQYVRGLTSHGDTPLSLACNRGDWEIARFLFQNGARLPEDIGLQRPMFHAIARADKSSVEFLFEVGGHVNMTNDDGDPLLVYALHTIAAAMDPSPATTRRRRRNNTLQANQGHDVRESLKGIITLLLDKGTDVNTTDSNGATALAKAMERADNADIVQILLDAGADIQISDLNNVGPLHVVAAEGNDDFANLLLALDADINQKTRGGRTPISIAAANGHEQLVQLFSEQEQLDATEEQKRRWKRTAQLYNVVQSGDTSTFNALVTPEQVTNCQDREGQTFLHRVSILGDLHMAETLLALGADFRIHDNKGYTVTHTAAQYDHGDIIRLLAERGADLVTPSNPDHDGWFGELDTPTHATPLHLAAFGGHLDTVETLFELAKYRSGTIPWHERGADDHSDHIDWGSDFCGRTALMCAAQMGHVETARFLLDHGAKVNAAGGRGSWGFSAWDLAKSAGHKEMIRLLEERGGETFDW